MGDYYYTIHAMLHAQLRALMAAQIMSAILSRGPSEMLPAALAGSAVHMTDALLRALADE